MGAAKSAAPPSLLLRVFVATTEAREVLLPLKIFTAFMVDLNSSLPTLPAILQEHWSILMKPQERKNLSPLNAPFEIMNTQIAKSRTGIF